MKTLKETLEEVWERMPDDLTSNDKCYSTQVEPHIKNAIKTALESVVPEKEIDKNYTVTPLNLGKIDIFKINQYNDVLILAQKINELIDYIHSDEYKEKIFELPIKNIKK